MHTLDSKALTSLLAKIVVTAVVAIVVVVGLYLFNFRGDLSLNADRWGQFGDYVGGTLNPILSFLALLSLCLTLAVQGRQLRISEEQLSFSRQELEATRQELQKSAESQATTATALIKQAEYTAISSRLSALNSALGITIESISHFQRAGTLEGPANHYRKLIAQKEEISNEILKITATLLQGEQRGRGD